MKDQEDIITTRTKDYVQIKILTGMHVQNLEISVNEVLIDLKNKDAFIQEITYYQLKNLPNHWNIVIQYIIPIETH